VGVRVLRTSTVSGTTGWVGYNDNPEHREKQKRKCSRCGLPVSQGGNSSKTPLCRDCVQVMGKVQADQWRNGLPKELAS
jgi:ribosomal protein S14